MLLNWNTCHHFLYSQENEKTKKKRNLKNATYNGITLFAAETE